ncbi:MAG: DUF1736 domain-containing protein [Bacteroidetes bacterium]|nr:DUF1736 domain-containing protein [Bacteroidota bacterium]
MTINLSTIKPIKFYILFVVLTFVLYGNSINNEYALDDNIVVEGNALVAQGIKAIPEIFKSRYASGKQEYEYRPMVTASFAVEKQFFRKLPEKQTKIEKKRKDKLTQANISHFINVLLYAFTCIILFNLLKVIFKSYHLLLPLLVTLIFLVHPIHTEVVDNIKSRDELFMMIGIILALFWQVKYTETNHYKYIFYAGLAILFAALSKRNAMAIYGLAPIVLYFIKADYKKIGIVLLSLIAISVMVVLMKKGLLTGKSTRNLMFFENPLYYQGTWLDRVTVGLYCSWFYLEMLIFPVKMSFYYGYNQIPMATFGNWQVWLALLFFIPLGIFGLMKFIKRDVLGLGIIIWFGVMLGVINVFFPIVGIVADRFSYIFSLGFCIVVVWILLKVFKINVTDIQSKIKLPNQLVITIGFIFVIYGGRTIARNPNWHDYMTLYNHDIEHLTESAKAHALLANTLYPMVIKDIQQNPSSPQIPKDVQTLIFHFKEAIRIDSTYSTSWNNLGSVYVNYIRDYNLSINYCKKAIIYNPDYVEAHFNIAYSYSAINNFDSAYYYGKKLIEIDPDYLKTYEFMNGLVTKNNKVNEWINDLIVLAQKSEKPKNIYVGIANLSSLNANGDYSTSIEYFEKAYQLDTADKVLCNHLIKLYQFMGNTEKANQYLINCK